MTSTHPAESEQTQHSRTYRPGLEGVVAAETRLSEVRGEQGELRIAGYMLSDYLARFDYAEAAAELWSLADHKTPVSAPTLRRDLGRARLQAHTVLKPLAPLLTQGEPLEAMRLGLELTRLQQPAEICAALAVALALHLQPEGPAPDPEAEHLADFLRLLHGSTGSLDAQKALQSYVLAVADHGLNASTFTARVIASTASDMSSAVLGAMGALKGPLHGGAPGPVLDMLDEIGDAQRAELWLDQHLAAGRRVMGFGHRVYRTRDPRADALKAALQRFRSSHDTGRLRQAEAVESAILRRLKAHKPERVIETNVEYYTALLLEALGFQREAFTAVFALGRVLGWCAHILEQRAHGRLIRPQSLYIGQRLDSHDSKFPRG